MPSPLAAADLSTEQPDPLVETKRELLNAYQHIEELQEALKGLLGLLVLIEHHPDVSPDLRECLHSNHRVIDAHEALLS
jgi:hypothetical protein